MRLATSWPMSTLRAESERPKSSAKSDTDRSQNTVSVAYEGQNEMVIDLQNRRDAISGVSVDEEMVHLIESRTLYQGALKYISAINEMMDDLANLL